MKFNSAINRHNDMDKSITMPSEKGYILFNSIYKTFWKRQNYRERKQISSYLGLEVVTEKAMATYSSTFAWKIPWAEEPGGLQTVGSAHTHRLLSGSG